MADDLQPKDPDSSENSNIEATQDQPASEASASDAPDTAASDNPEEYGADGVKVSFVDPPAYSIEYKGQCAYEVGVSIAAPNFEAQEAKLLEELHKEIEMPGFRRGRAPIKLVERKFAKAVRSEAEAKLIAASIDKLVKDNQFSLVSQPDIDGLEAEKTHEPGTPVSFTVKFEVAARVDLGKYRGLELEKPIQTVTDEMVSEAIDHIRDRSAIFETLEGGIAADGDQLIIDFKGTVDGVEFPGGSATDYPYIVGSKRFLQEFDQALLGASPGDNLSCSVTFPDDYAANLSGKTAEFAITVKEAKRRIRPELNDEFAKQNNADSVEALKERLREQLQARFDELAKQSLERNAIDAVINGSQFEMPESVVKSTAEAVYQDQLRELLSMRIPMDKIREREDEMRSAAREAAEHQMKTLVALHEIADAEGIEVSDEDYESAISDAAVSAGVDVSTALAYMEQNTDRQYSYKDRILRQKALQIIIDNATVTDKPVTADQPDTPAESPADGE